MDDTKCVGNCIECLVAAPQQPTGDDWSMADGVFIKQISIVGRGLLVPQHQHRFDHTTLIAAGSIRVWCDGDLIGDFKAPHPLFIKAGVKHLFLTLSEEVLLFCIHRIDRTGAVEIESEHSIVEPG